MHEERNPFERPIAAAIIWLLMILLPGLALLSGVALVVGTVCVIVRGSIS
jgi:hypothetical protein